jgi:hypothetical protein
MKHRWNTESGDLRNPYRNHPSLRTDDKGLERGCVEDQPQHAMISAVLRLAFSTVALRGCGFAALGSIRVPSVAKSH